MWREKILSFKPHLTVTARYGAVGDESSVCSAVEQVNGVKGAAAVVETLVLMEKDGRLMAPVVLGVSPASAAKVSRVPEYVCEGVFDLDGEQTVVGCDLASRLGVKVGDKVLVYSPRNVVSKDELYLPEELTVAGIFNLGMRDYDGNFALTSLEMGRELVGMTDGAHAVYVMTDNPFRFEEYAGNLRAALGPSYDIRTWREVDSVMFSALSHEKTMMFVLLVFITVVAIFCVTNTLIVITVQKTHEIGLLKALGFSPQSIMAAFVLHGWIQCLVGTAAGIGAGLAVLHNLKRIVRFLLLFNVEVFPKSIYGLSEIPWNTSFGELARVSLFVMGFCTLASMIPAWRAAQMDPVEALRHE
jgi:lipoprotein-releasing system permease protein